MILKKISPKGRSIRVTFEVPLEYAAHAVSVVGDFNNWDTEEHPMTRNIRKGVWTKSVSFKPGTSVEFRYFIDGHKWHNEPHADAQAPNPHYSENSVLTL
ncbi:MAG: isoamylase early set domain-containing protein [Bacteroidetes bacterium]|nr:isoamylase early set domain-containing protein [Bacteroidota bacterium]MCY4205163.1 isoamylase early set domain-containing protein [Bacteroidota bacterium]